MLRVKETRPPLASVFEDLTGSSTHALRKDPRDTSKNNARTFLPGR